MPVPRPLNDDLSRKEEIFPQRSGKDWIPYRGEPGLIIAIDIGTTYSGASYCILQPGKKPAIEDVKSFPGQQTSAGKVPSIILYDSAGNPALYGAEAVDGSSAYRLLEQGGQTAKWWKLYLKPNHLDLIVDEDTASKTDLEPLPFNIRPESIVAQFLAYMSSCVGRYIVSRHSNGIEILQTYADNVRYVVTIPNGWELPQQQVLRNACVEAGLITPDQAHLVAFVSEAEASINFCAHATGTNGWLEEAGQQVIVCDAGGGTIDISTYEVHSVMPRLLLTETSISDCLIAGSTLVDRRAMTMLKQRLAGTEWDNDADLQDLQLRFCSSIKETFTDPTEEQYLAIGSAAVHRDEPLIRRGKLILSGADVAALFEPSIAATVKSIEARVDRKRIDAIPIAMVGGFSESIYFRNELQKRLGKKVKLCKPDEATSKAVASGAVAWLVDGAVGMRVSKLSYGISCSVLYRESRQDHVARQGQVFAGKDGRMRLPKAFGVVLRKGQTNEEGKTFTEPFTMRWNVNERLETTVALVVFRGEDDYTAAFLDEPGFEELCQFKIDMEPFRPLFRQVPSPQGYYYFEVPINLAMQLCGTEISAQILFDHNGETYGGPVTAITDTRMDG